MRQVTSVKLSFTGYLKYDSDYFEKWEKALRIKRLGQKIPFLHLFYNLNICTIILVN